MTELCFNQR